MPDTVTMRESELEARRWRKLEHAVLVLNRLESEHSPYDIELVSIKLKMPEYLYGECFVILAALDGEGTPVVAFHSEERADQALAGALNRLHNGKLKWKVDEYRIKQHANPDVKG